jgi:hypothetical protein
VPNLVYLLNTVELLLRFQFSYVKEIRTLFEDSTFLIREFSYNYQHSESYPFCLRIHVEPALLAPIDSASLCGGVGRERKRLSLSIRPNLAGSTCRRGKYLISEDLSFKFLSFYINIPLS